MIVRPKHLYLGLCQATQKYELGKNIRPWSAYGGYLSPREEIYRGFIDNLIDLQINPGELWQIKSIKLERVK